MELELATLDDMIEELKRRELPFAFVSTNPTNRPRVKMLCANQSTSPNEIVRMLRQLQRHICDDSEPENL